MVTVFEEVQAGRYKVVGVTSAQKKRPQASSSGKEGWEGRRGEREGGGKGGGRGEREDGGEGQRRGGRERG